MEPSKGHPAARHKAVIAVLTVLVIVLALALLGEMKKNQKTEKQPAQQVSQELKEKMLQSFPPDFVVDKEAKEIATDVSADGQKITRVFQSSQALDQLLKSYADVMANLKWVQLNKFQTAANITVVSYRGSGSSMNLTLEKNDNGTKYAVTYYPLAAGLGIK